LCIEKLLSAVQRSLSEPLVVIARLGILKTAFNLLITSHYRVLVEAYQM
jgi:hypothetical protein